MAAVLGLAASCTDEQFEVMLYVNEDRSDANLELLQWDETLGENVGYGATIASVHRGYMNSSGHRQNILDRRFNYIGVGYAKSGNRVYTVQVFMKR